MHLTALDAYFCNMSYKVEQWISMELVRIWFFIASSTFIHFPTFSTHILSNIDVLP